MAIEKQAAAKRVWNEMEASGDNLDHEWVVSEAISLTGDPRLHPADERLTYQDLGERFSLARQLIFSLAFPKTGGGPESPEEAKRSVVITLEGDESLKSEKWEEADEKTKEFRAKVKKIGYVDLRKEDLEELNHKGFLPKDIQGTEITTALHLYARGANSTDLTQKAESSLGATQGERDYLLRTAYFLACFEEANLKEGLPSSQLLQLSNLSPESDILIYDSPVEANDNQFVIASNGEVLAPLVNFDTQDDQLQGLRNDMSDMVFKAVDKGAKKVIKKGEKEAAEKVAEGVAGKAVAGAVEKEAVGIAAKAGVKLAVKGTVMAGAEAVGTSVPIIGNIIAWLVVEVGDRLLSLLGKAIQKIKENPEILAALGLGALAGGLAFGILPLTLLGAGALLVAGSAIGSSIAAIVGAAVAIVAYMIGTVVQILGTVLAYFVGFMIIVIMIFYVITVGGYVVPYWDGGANPGNVSTENPYIGVGKVADPTKALNPGKVVYTITITAKQGNLTNVTISDYKCQAIKKTGPPIDCSSTASNLPDLTDLVVEVNNPYTFTYEVTYNGSFANSLVVDTITITADTPTQSGVSSSSTAAVCFGDCPEDCPTIWPVNSGALTQGRQTAAGNSHNGLEAIDIGSVGDGTTVYATHRGVVEYPSGPNCDGNVVLIRATCNGNEFTSRYSHLGSRSVSPGDIVEPGAPIGTTDNSGTCTTGSHLHYAFNGLTMEPPWIPKEIQPVDNCCSVCSASDTPCDTQIP